ncbi:UNKNOWN [Stylonychia lemnae]|uniref:Uncharacterized protein n=1 Tax=Stylonychia lemnae TaxID=5949 RepID=A0A078BDW3_STYLE|nr:UNKNOWN [Stylonychia lemnae]|eukprot:CDW91357.1 UNKNOWN [Stylonychia lemnae]
MDNSQFSQKLQTLSLKLETLAFRIIKLSSVTENAEDYTRFQYYHFKNEILELTSEISADIEEFGEDEKKKIDAKIVFDAFNQQIQKLERIFLSEDVYAFNQKQLFEAGFENGMESGPRRTTIITKKSSSQVADLELSHEDRQIEQNILSMTQDQISQEKSDSIAVLKLAAVYESQEESQKQVEKYASMLNMDNFKEFLCQHKVEATKEGDLKAQSRKKGLKKLFGKFLGGILGNLLALKHHKKSKKAMKRMFWKKYESQIQEIEKPLDEGVRTQEMQNQV